MTSRFLLFKASAGSGKTFNLAQQYIALLITRGEHEFRHTLAVTFTNKATAEMKDRILGFLYNFWKWKGRPEDFEALKALLRDDYHMELPEEELRERCHRALHAILHDYSRFYVSTIDAFFQTVLRNMAHELGLNARLQVDLDDKDVIERAVENLIDNLRHNNRDVLPWLRQYIEQQLADGRSWDVRRELKRMAHMLFQEEYLKRSLDEGNLPFNIKNIAHFRKLLTEERELAIAPLKTEAEAFEQEMQRTGMGYEELLSYSNDVRRFVEKAKGGALDANYGKRLQDMADDPMKLLKSGLRKDASLRPVAETLSERLGRLGDLYKQTARRVGSIDLVLTNLTPMGLLGAIDKEVTRLTNERNRFMLAHTPIMLKKMIGEDDASFVFERIGTRYHNIMIDEFQDTSQLQWENFRTLLLDNLASGGLSMIVGDIKQSIYRWRNGDWRILHNLERHGHLGTPLTARPLRENYRSLGHIVDFNNRFFPEAAKTLDSLAEDNDLRLANLYPEEDVRQGITKDRDGGYVRIRLCHTEDKATEEGWEEMMLADLCEQVRDLHGRGMPYSQMTILLRKNRYVEPLITYFAQHMPEVPLVSSEAFLLGSSVAVNMLMCALQMVDDESRNPVAARYLAKHYQRDVLHREATENDVLLEPIETLLPEDFIQHLDELRHMPLYELCETLYQRLGLKEIGQQDAYLFTFFDELARYLRDNPSDIPTLLQYWDEQMGRVPIPNGEVEGIRIFTIHKSKGLAFHTVLMPYADWDMEKDRTDGLYWCKPQDTLLSGMGSLPIKFTTRTKDSTFANDYLTEHVNRRADELNALYVAFTRAKANLYVWGLSRETLARENYNAGVADLMYQVLGTEEYTEGSGPAIPEKEREDSGETVSVRMCSYESSQTFRQSTGATQFVQDMGAEPAEGDEETATQAEAESRRSYIEQGKLLHYIFSQIETANDIDRVARRLAQQGILTQKKEIEQAGRLAHNGLRNERVRDWFSGHYRLFNECNILVPDTRTGKLAKKRPDRVMVSDQRIIIVDFKFGSPKAEYHDQVREYMNILQAMHPQHKVEGWLWYVYKNKVEAVL